jgi:Glycine rich protein/Bacterial Ig domain
MRGIGWWLGLAAVLVATVGAAEPAVAQVTEFSYTGSEQTYIVPAGVSSIRLTAVGAPGGGPQTGLAAGRGAFVSGIVSVTPGQTLYVEVGGTGGAPAGGFNGGGGGGGPGGLGAYGGGGASDVRTLPMSAGPISSPSRLIVAAGGGGSASPAAAGGDAGQPGTSSPGSSIEGGAGTQTAGGAGGCDALMTGCGMAGSLGIGGDGGTSGDGGAQIRSGSGGGGGLYGGGGGGGVLCTLAVGCGTGGGEVGGGGGGSSLVPSDMGRMQLASFATAPVVGITPVPPPTCQNVTRSTTYGLAVIVQLNCTELAGQSLTYAIVRAPAHGRLSGLMAGGQVTVTYTPTAGFLGTDSFTFDGSSTNGTSVAASVSITVTPRSVAGARHARRSETGAKIPITCTAHGVGATRDCDVTVTMSVTRTTKVVTVGRATVVVRAGHIDIVAIALNGRGKHLLAARGKLRVSIAVTQTVSGDHILVSHQRLTLSIGSAKPA